MEKSFTKFTSGVYLSVTGGGMIYISDPNTLTTQVKAYKINGSDRVCKNDIYINSHNSNIRLTVVEIINDSYETIFLRHSGKYDLWNRASDEIRNSDYEHTVKTQKKSNKTNSQQVIKKDQATSMSTSNIPIMTANMPTNTTNSIIPSSSSCTTFRTINLNDYIDIFLKDEDIEIDDNEFDNLISEGIKRTKY
jgi:hypothetical protein